ncbi:hypothetical protein PAHAL_1G207800 [Panicum hallii]|uniref:Uncharacterized protein n=1 Tax=Panicum hallii TaxID=206008 RepID=A0A2T8KVX4_9POAL|nr:hypothetical protein PAHAL_1G207800 [Panicum hallii]
MHIPQQPGIEPEQVTDTYPLSRDQNLGMAYDVTSAVEAEASLASRTACRCHQMSTFQHTRRSWRRVLDFGVPLVAMAMTPSFHHKHPTRHRLQVSVHTQPTPCPRVHLHTQPSR